MIRLRLLQITPYRIISSLFLLFICCCGTAQNEQLDKAIIYTFDGSVFIGEIVAENDLELMMQVVTTDIITVNKGMINRMYRGEHEVLIHRGGKIHYNSGVFFSTTFGGGGTDTNSSGEWDFILGKRLNKYYSVGIGMAFTNHTLDLVFTTLDPGFIPVYGYGRYYLTHKRARLFGAAKLGWGFPSGFGFEINHSGGLYFQPSVGIHFASKKARRFIIAIANTIQNVSGNNVFFDQFSNPVTTNYNLWMNRVLIKIGIEIH